MLQKTNIRYFVSRVSIFLPRRHRAATFLTGKHYTRTRVQWWTALDVLANKLICLPMVSIASGKFSSCNGHFWQRANRSPKEALGQDLWSFCSGRYPRGYSSQGNNSHWTFDVIIRCFSHYAALAGLLEMDRAQYSAYKVGRTTKDPTEGWYSGEIWFFDN